MQYTDAENIQKRNRIDLRRAYWPSLKHRRPALCKFVVIRKRVRVPNPIIRYGRDVEGMDVEGMDINERVSRGILNKLSKKLKNKFKSVISRFKSRFKSRSRSFTNSKSGSRSFTDSKSRSFDKPKFKFVRKAIRGSRCPNGRRAHPPACKCY